jgi:hypothetical protein
MDSKNHHKSPAAIINLRAFEVAGDKKFIEKKHTPRSVCDSKRDRLRGKDPMAEEEFQ